MDENKGAIEAAIARIQAPQPEGQSLKSAVNAMGTRVGGKVFPRACGGVGVCKILICDHKYATNKGKGVVEPVVEDPRLSPKLINSLLQKCKGDGYPVTDYYLKEMYQNAGFNVLGAIKAIKSDIDRRERILHESGRVNMGRENAMRGTDLDQRAFPPFPPPPAPAPAQTCSHGVSHPLRKHILGAAANETADAEAEASAASEPAEYTLSLPYFRDTFLTLLENEDALIRDATASYTNASPAANLHTGATARRTLMSRFRTREEREQGLQAYIDEGKWRTARARHWKESKSQGLSGNELEICMQVWEDENGGYTELMGGGWRESNVEKIAVDEGEEDQDELEELDDNEVGESSSATLPAPYEWEEDQSLEDPVADAKWEELKRTVKMPVKNSIANPLPNPINMELAHTYILANGGPEELILQKQKARDCIEAEMAARRILWKENREAISKAAKEATQAAEEAAHEANVAKLANLTVDTETPGQKSSAIHRRPRAWLELLVNMGDPENPDHAQVMKMESVFPKPKYAQGAWERGFSAIPNPDVERVPQKREKERVLPPKTFMEYESQAGVDVVKLGMPAGAGDGIEYIYDRGEPNIAPGLGSDSGLVDNAAQDVADEQLTLQSVSKQGVVANVRKNRKASVEDQRAAAGRKSARDQYLREELYTQDFTLESIASNSVTEQQKISRLRILAGKLGAENRLLKITNVELKARVLQNLLSTAEVKSVGEPAYIMRTAARIGDLNLKFEFTDDKDATKLGCDKMYYLIEELNHKLDSFTRKILDESNRNSALEAWTAVMGTLSLKKLCEEAILTNSLLMVEDLEQMIDWTYASAGICDDMIVFYSRACRDPHEIQLRLASKKFQADMKEFMRLCRKVVELPVDLSAAGVAKAKDEFGSQDEEKTEDYLIHRMRNITQCHCPEDVLNAENAAFYDELLEMARDFDSIVFPYVVVLEDPFDFFKRVANVFLSGNSTPKTQAQIEEVHTMLASQNVPTKLALLALLGELLDGVPDENSQMRALVRASLRKDFEILFKYYLMNRPDILQSAGVVFLEGVTGMRYQDLSTGQALRSVQQLDGVKIWKWLLTFQFARSRIETEWEEAIGAEHLVLPKGWTEEVAEIKKQIADAGTDGQGLTGEQYLGKLIGIDPIKDKLDDKKALKKTMKNLGLEPMVGAPSTDRSAHQATVEEDIQYDEREKQVLTKLEAGEAALSFEKDPPVSKKARGKLSAIPEDESTDSVK